MRPKGHYIVVEGLEGAGKSTALTAIKCLLSEQGIHDTITTREPGGTRVGETVRTVIKDASEKEPLDPRAELLLLYAARVQLMERVIRPALARGCWVLADRFELSTFAYQGGGRMLDKQMIAQLSTFCLHGIQPDLILFLDVSPQQGLRRARKRGKADRIERESLAFFTRVHDAYHAQLKQLQQVVIIDATQPLVTVQEALRAALLHYLSDHVTSTTD